MKNTNTEKQFRIGELAAKLALNPKTIRYYEEIGLLPAPQRTLAGYRLYETADCERLRFIGKAKALGLTLQEIGDILTLRRNGDSPCAHVLALLDHKLATLDEQLRLLLEFRQELSTLRAAATYTMINEARICGIIESQKIIHLSAE